MFMTDSLNRFLIDAIIFLMSTDKSNEYNTMACLRKRLFVLWK
jgi:hypothetical protein